MALSGPILPPQSQIIAAGDPGTVEGYRAFSVDFDVPAGTTTFTETFTYILADVLMTSVQGVYIDNSHNPYLAQLIFNGIKQVVTIGPYSQGYFPLRLQKGSFSGTFRTYASYIADFTTSVSFFNYLTPLSTWSTIINIPPVTHQTWIKSFQLTTSPTPNVKTLVLPSNPFRTCVIIAANPANANNIFIFVVTDAGQSCIGAVGPTSPPFIFGNSSFIPANDIWISSPTASQSFFVTEANPTVL